VERVDRLPHLGAEDVADRARALAGARDAVEDRRRVLGVERERAQHLVARRRVLGRLAGHDRQQVVPGEQHAGRVVGPRLHVGVEDAVEHARRVLGACELTADPVQLVGDAG